MGVLTRKTNVRRIRTNLDETCRIRQKLRAEGTPENLIRR